MCVAQLNVCVQPCQHRWYSLLRPCQSSRNLSNCPEKLSLEGWENKCDTCPWCSSPNNTTDTNNINSSSPAAATDDDNLILLSSSAGSERRGSGGSRSRSRQSSSSSTSLARRASLARTSSTTSTTSLRNRRQSMKIEAILPADPSPVLPASWATNAAGAGAPGGTSLSSSASSSSQTIADQKPYHPALSSSPYVSGSPRSSRSLERPSSRMSSLLDRSWSKSKRWSCGLIK
ncbi:hypothetical protein L228DRAFT_126830 [Xylona heveae TC161]|uniref:Uncharacterized protein n=1 Tax=Xylona heveae (strain CBS 132557 / TC161) TaxID=1328760 RepID=A0A165GQQ4_XYLHT|nr:hypothetical protein L228DRAFT_126830 [Xylona heveae TC161]KZF22476.1 hypothetical protein L228DRAFT_126830 [Xylona heveae TC161]